MATRSRRTRAQWQQRVEDWQHSGLSAKQYCTTHQLGYASFCKWRTRLASPTTAEPASFIELPAAAAVSATSGGWQIVLCLGEGMELRLSRT